MSVQFGRWNWGNQPPAPDYIERVNATLAPYGPDSNESYSMGGVKILYRAFNTTKESHFERQPHISASGAVITWDGRLDNRAELISELREFLTISSTDIEIVAAAFERWGDRCFGKLIGDWALSIWNPRERSLLLAKDPIGTKHLYYSMEKDHLTWSTILDPLVLYASRTFEICEEYIAGWFATMFPAAHLTPYVGIQAVPPSSSVLIRNRKKHVINRYWDFDPGKRIRYRTDAEYEEHFRSAFFTSVQRRLRSDRPVLAELSGGMDSSSIVCMADLIIAGAHTDCPRLDTVTWYDGSNPNWGELPYFTKVEERRGCVGHHIDGRSLRRDSSQKRFGAEFESDRFTATPIANNGQSEFFKQNAAYIMSRGYRVTLSGIGGEVTGDGVPTATPELQNLLARARFFTLAHRLNAWAAKMGESRLSLLWEAVQGFFSSRVNVLKEMHPPHWLHPSFVRRNRNAFRGYPLRVKLCGPLPSFQDHTDKLGANRRFVAHCHLSSELLREVRYPYYDRDFLEFVYAIPREQIVGVGQRRFLMRRALVGIVPGEILSRRKKETVPQKTAKSISVEWPSVTEIGQLMISSFVGVIDLDRFEEALQKARRDEEAPIESLKRTLKLEAWLRHLMIQGVLTNAMAARRHSYSSALRAKEVSAPAQSKSSAS